MGDRVYTLKAQLDGGAVRRGEVLVLKALKVLTVLTGFLGPDS